MQYNLINKKDKGLAPCAVFDIFTINQLLADNQLVTSKGDFDNTAGLQVFNSGFRMILDYEDIWEYWNGDIFLDLDSKNASDIDSLDKEKFEQDLYDCLETHIGNNFHWLQRSNSGNSWHIVFHFNTEQFEKNRENFDKLVVYCRGILKKAVIELGKEHWIKEDEIFNAGIFDSHNDTPTQVLYLSKNPIKINTLHAYIDNTMVNWFGNRKDIDSLLNISLPEGYDENAKISFDDFIVNSDRFNINPYANFKDLGSGHDVRRRVIRILGEVFQGDKQKTLEIYSLLIPYFVANGLTKHNERKLKSLFNAQFSSIMKIDSVSEKTYRWLKTNLNLDIVLKPKFKENYKDKTVFDKTYTLKKSQHLSDIIDDIIHIDTNKIIHIECGCGVGKTFSAKFLAKSKENNDIFSLNFMDGKMLRICFVTPMTSINKDNFTGEKNWIIIDNEHQPKSNEWRSRNVNVCTTWNNFCLRDMDTVNFDIIMFDEIHSLYLYDYRVKDITNIKAKIKQIKDSISKNKKIIFLTGTPGYERYEFNTYNIKVIKEENLVKTDLIFYNENYMGHLVNDIKSWITKDSLNQAYIFNNITSDSFVQKLEIRGLNVDMAYYKSNFEDTEFVFKNKRVNGQVAVFSVFGQSGINLFPDRPVRIYVLNTNGTEIIQYLNRVRNKERIDKITVYFKRDNIRNRKPEFSNKIDYDTADKKIDNINRTYRTGDYKEYNDGKTLEISNLFDIKRNGFRNHLFYMRFGLILDVITKNFNEDNNIEWFSLNSDVYKTWQLCKKTREYESSIQTIYYRLKTNYCDIDTIYSDEDIPDPVDKSLRRDTFAGQIIRFSEEDIDRNKKTGELYINSENNALNKVLDNKTKKSIETILNHYFFMIDVSERHLLWKTAADKFASWAREIASAKGTIKKHDINLYAQFLYIAHDKRFDNNIHYRLYMEYKNKNKIEKFTNEQIIDVAAAYFGFLYLGQSKDEITNMFEDVYKFTKNLDEIYRNFRDYFETHTIDMEVNFNDLSENSMKMVSDCKRYLIKKYTDHGNIKGKIYQYKDENGNIIEGKQLIDLADKLGISLRKVKYMRSKNEIKLVTK